MKLIFVMILVVSAVTADHEEKCGKNEKYNPCGSLCISTCNNRQFANCATQCNPGCFCKDGYIRSKLNGPCIKISECRYVM
ncbi:unnamed protein product [Ceutorhynchus assimilis]|uniref:TIL domain-containing protein n=1 Tax=Ceutorhynchus assimilis TaxID=467358 RepID=A0A9N9MFK1_9CUCU|nr:unnamed protein product [Ceutorhynchus assimilis]